MVVSVIAVWLNFGGNPSQVLWTTGALLIFGGIALLSLRSVPELPWIAGFLMLWTNLYNLTDTCTPLVDLLAASLFTGLITLMFQTLLSLDNKPAEEETACE
jgi:hypothetical protein